MNIPENFDRWMFDYLEGNLSVSEKSEFEAFLVQNPNYEIDAEVWQDAFVKDDNVVYMHQDALLKKRRFAGWFNWQSAAAILFLFGASATLYFLSGEENLNETLLVDSNLTAASSFVAKGPSSPDKTENNFLAAHQTIQQDKIAEVTSNDGAGQKSVTLAKSSSKEISQHVLESQTDVNTKEEQSQKASLSLLSGLNPTPFEKREHSRPQSIMVDEVGGKKVSESDALKQESEKFDSDNFTSSYLKNPEENGVELALRANKVSHRSPLGKTINKFKKGIEKSLTYPVGLVNLRDPELLLPNTSLMSFNAAFTGGMLKSRFETIYRNQWTGSGLASQNITMSYDTYSSQIKGGVGVMLNANYLSNGGFGDYNVSLFYSPKISLSKNVILEPAIKVEMGQLVQDVKILGVSNDFELSRGQILNSAGNNGDATQGLWYKDYGLGLVLNTKWFYIGANLDNIAGHYASVYASESGVPERTPHVFSAIIGGDWENDKEIVTFSPFIAYRDYGTVQEAWAGANFKYENFILGGSVSSQLNFVGSIGVKFKSFKLAYQIDQTNSTLTQNNLLSHSLSVRFNGKLKNARFKY
jgi:type IX secretion system PorP/SprF family membrane protein